MGVPLQGGDGVGYRAGGRPHAPALGQGVSLPAGPLDSLTADPAGQCCIRGGGATAGALLAAGLAGPGGQGGAALRVCVGGGEGWLAAALGQGGEGPHGLGWLGGEPGWRAAIEVRPHKHTSYATPPPRLASNRANVTLTHQPTHCLARCRVAVRRSSALTVQAALLLAAAGTGAGALERSWQQMSPRAATRRSHAPLAAPPYSVRNRPIRRQQCTGQAALRHPWKQKRTTLLTSGRPVAS